MFVKTQKGNKIVKATDMFVQKTTLKEIKDYGYANFDPITYALYKRWDIYGVFGRRADGSFALLGLYLKKERALKNIELFLNNVGNGKGYYEMLEDFDEFGENIYANN